jgi:hypothetical protein
MFVVTAVAAASALHNWCAITQSWNLHNLGHRSHLIVVVLTKINQRNALEDYIAPSSIVKRIVLNDENGAIDKNASVAHLAGLYYAIDGFKTQSFLFVEPQICFIYDPDHTELQRYVGQGGCYAATIEDRIKPAELPGATAAFVFKGRSIGASLWGGQYIIDPRVISKAEIQNLVNAAADIFSVEGFMHPQLLAWHMIFPGRKLFKAWAQSLVSLTTDDPFNHNACSRGESRIMLRFADSGVPRSLENVFAREPPPVVITDPDPRYCMFAYFTAVLHAGKSLSSFLNNKKSET